MFDSCWLLVDSKWLFSPKVIFWNIENVDETCWLFCNSQAMVSIETEKYQKPMAGSHQFDYLILAGWFPGGQWLRSNRPIASIARSFNASNNLWISQAFWFFYCLSALAQRWHHVDEWQYGSMSISKVEHGVILISSPFEGVSLDSSCFLFSSLSCLETTLWAGQPVQKDAICVSRSTIRKKRKKASCRSWKRTNRPSNDDASRGLWWWDQQIKNCQTEWLYKIY